MYNNPMGSAHSELIKNFSNIRSYMREFYIFGFRSYDEYNKSNKTYYDERLRIANWLGEAMVIPSAGVKEYNDFISISSRTIQHNPLYNAWKSKSFRNSRVDNHFMLLSAFGIQMPVAADTFEKNMQKFLTTYAKMGYLDKEKWGRKNYYKLRNDNGIDNWSHPLNFFSEAAPCGVIGSFALDKVKNPEKSIFMFKHNYLVNALDAEVMANVFCAIRDHKKMTIMHATSYDAEPEEISIIPMKVLIGASTGRSYVAARNEQNTMNSYRLDYITSIKKMEDCNNYEELKEDYEEREQFLWGVSFGNNYPETETVEFTIKVSDEEYFIKDRMIREKRNGKVTELPNNEYKYEATVYDSKELIPWIRSFLGFITELKLSNEDVLNSLKEGVREMMEMYKDTED